MHQPEHGSGEVKKQITTTIRITKDELLRLVEKEYNLNYSNPTLIRYFEDSYLEEDKKVYRTGELVIKYEN